MEDFEKILKILGNFNQISMKHLKLTHNSLKIIKSFTALMHEYFANILKHFMVKFVLFKFYYCCYLLSLFYYYLFNNITRMHLEID